MKKQFIVNTPFGIGVATSNEDLKNLLSFIEGITGEGAEQSEAQQAEACDCENCQSNVAKLEVLKTIVATITDGYTLDSMEQDIHDEMERTSHPNTRAHLEEAFRIVHQRNSNLMKETAENFGEVPEDDSAFVKLDKEIVDMADKDLLSKKLSRDISFINSLDDLTMLHSFREFMTTVLESESPNKKREAELLIGKVDERLTELTGESDADKVEGKTTRGKPNPDLLDLDRVSTTVDIGADMLASIDLGYVVSKKKMINLIRRSTDILDEYLKEQVEKMNAPEAPVEDSTAEELQGRYAFSFEAINDMTDYDEVDKLQIELEGKMNQLSDKKQAEVDRFHEEMKRIEDLHAAAAQRKAVILEDKADIAHADMADKVKALQEAITRSQPHLLIHDDVREAMEILQERYSKQ